MSRTSSGLFRREAIAHYLDPKEEGAPLRLYSPWVDHAYGVLLVTVLFGLLLLTALQIPTYARGAAVLSARGRIEIPALQTGRIAAVYVSAGQRVRRGQRLLQLDDSQQVHELERIREQRRKSLAAHHQFPSPGGAAQGDIAQLDAQVQQAEAHVRERAVFAPQAGLVTDLRVRSSQHVAPGELLLTLDSGDGFDVIAFLPGHSRPALHSGSKLRLLLDGYPDSTLLVDIDHAADEVIGPESARRALRVAHGDSLPLPGAVVRVEAHLPRSCFSLDGQQIPLFDGMRARADFVVRRTSLAALLGLAFSQVSGALHDAR